MKLLAKITKSYENYLKQNQSTTQQRAAKEPTFTCAKEPVILARPVH